MQYFVTGATGFIGGYVTAHLLAGEHAVTALVRNPEEAAAIAAYGVVPHVGSVADKASMRRGMRGADGVFHIAGHRMAFSDRKTAEVVQVTGTSNVLELARELGVSRVVYTSTLSVLGDTKGRAVSETHAPGSLVTRYDRIRAKAHFEVALPMVRRGLPLVTVMPGVVYGPRDTSSLAGLFTRYLRGRVPAVGSRTAFSWSHVEDVAQAHIRAMHWGRPGESYILAGAHHRLRDAMAIAGRSVGRRRAPYPIHPWLIRPFAEVARVITAPVPPLRPLADRLRLAAGVTHLGDDAKARGELGWEPRSLAEGMPDAVRAMLQDLFEAA